MLQFSIIMRHIDTQMKPQFNMHIMPNGRNYEYVLCNLSILGMLLRYIRAFPFYHMLLYSNHTAVKCSIEIGRQFLVYF